MLTPSECVGAGAGALAVWGTCVKWISVMKPQHVHTMNPHDQEAINRALNRYTAQRYAHSHNEEELQRLIQVQEQRNHRLDYLKKQADDDLAHVEGYDELLKRLYVRDKITLEFLEERLWRWLVVRDERGLG